MRNASRANSKEQIDSESTTIQSISSLACTGHASICTIVSVGPLPNLRHLRMIQSDSAADLCCSASLLEAYCAPSAPTKRSHQGACAATKSLLGSSTASILAESAAQERQLPSQRLLMACGADSALDHQRICSASPPSCFSSCFFLQAASRRPCMSQYLHSSSGNWLFAPFSSPCPSPLKFP